MAFYREDDCTECFYYPESQYKGGENEKIDL